MKYLFPRTSATAILTFLSLLVAAQNYAPFAATVTKRFYNSASPSDNSYFFYADSVDTAASGITVFHQYFTLQQNANGANASGCGFWGSQVSHLTADTTWLGVNISYNSSNKHLMLKNADADTLDFDFAIPPGDSAKFFQNSAGTWYLKAGQPQIETFYGVTDSVKTFSILQYDASNQIVNSGLHGKDIKVGKQSGLLGFIDAYHFPAVKTHMILQGQLNPLIGTYQLRFEDLYPFQPGDSLQYAGYGKTQGCAYVVVYRIVTRTETTSQVTITFSKKIDHTSTFPPPSACPAGEVYPATLSFSKNSDLIGYPYNRLIDKTYDLTEAGSGFERRGEVSVSTICGARTGYTAEAMAATYCRSCACIGDVDASPMTLPTKIFVKGLGIVGQASKGVQPSAPGGMWHASLSLVYAALGSSVCGSFIHAGVAENVNGIQSAYPNPVESEITINDPVDQLSILAATGTTILTLNEPPARFSVAHLAAGVYILALKTPDRIIYHRFIKL